MNEDSRSNSQLPTIIEGQITTLDSPLKRKSFLSNKDYPSTQHVDFERQLSPLDPMSDRVSTILVWQHLTVQIREDKRREFLSTNEIL